MATNSETSLQYVSSASPDGLVEACFFNNMKRGKYINYHSVTFADGKWFAWYQDEINPLELKQKKSKK